MFTLFKHWLAWWRDVGLEFRLGPPTSALIAADVGVRVRLQKFGRELQRQKNSDRSQILIFAEGAENSFPEMADKAWRVEAWRVACAVLGEQWCDVRFCQPGVLSRREGWVFSARRWPLRKYPSAQ